MPERIEAGSGRETGYNAARSSEGIFPQRPKRPPRPPRERPRISLGNLPLRPLSAMAAALVLLVAGVTGYAFYRDRNCVAFGEGRTQLSSADGLFSLSVFPGDMRGSFGAEITSATLDASALASREMLDGISKIGSQSRAIGPIYGIRSCASAPSAASLRMILPAGVDARQAGLMDLYGWDATRREWTWLGGQADAASRAVQLRVSKIPQQVVLVQSSFGRAIANVEVLPDSTITPDFIAALDRLTAVGLYLGDEGSISGLRGNLFTTPEAAARRAISVRNWNLRGDVNRTLLRAMLGVDAYRRSHVNNLVNMVGLSASQGLELDYRGLPEDGTALYTQLLQSLAQELRSQGRWLSVGVPAPVQTGGVWSVPGYDIDAIGAAADEVKIDLATNPLLQTGNQLEDMLSWFTQRVPRSKLVVVVPMSSLSVAPNGDVAHISLADASQAFGVIEPVSNLEAGVASGSRVQFRLRHRFEPNSLVFDETSQSYRYTYQDLRGIPQTVWLNNAASLGRLLQRLSQVSLKGIAFRGLEPDFDDAASRQVLLAALRRTAFPSGAELPRLTWSVTAPDTSIQSEAGKLQDNQFTWIAPSVPGRYLIGAQFSGAGGTGRGGGYEVIVVSKPGQVATGDRALSVSSGPAAVAAPAVPVTRTDQAQSPLDLAIALGLPKPLVPAGDDGSFELGGQVAGLSSFERARSAGMTWVRLTVRDFADPSAFISAAHANNFKVLVAAVGNRARIIDDDYQALWTAHLGAIAVSGADAIEVWHEPNLAVEWPAGRISGESYTRLLARAYNAIKQRNPRTMVISAGLAPTGAFSGGCNQQGCDDSAFLSEMARAGASEYADCVGVHYTGGTVSPAQSSGAASGSHYSWYYAPLREQYSSVFGGVRKLCFTSFGYLAGEGLGALPARYSWAQGNTANNQAQWLAQAATLSAASGRVRLMVVWNLDLQQWNAERADVRAGYALIRPGGACPACDALRAAVGAK